MTQRDISQYDIDDHRAQRTLNAVRQFVAEFTHRQEIGELRRLVNGKQVNSGILGQAREDFTEHELIQPCLHALGYTDPQQETSGTSEPQLRRQPTAFEKVERKRPDYELQHVHEGLTCILEAKAVNREPADERGQATKDIEVYLEDNTFCTQDTLAGQEVLVGIGTDGFRWVLWIKDLEHGVLYEDIARVSITGAVREIMAIQRQEHVTKAAAREARTAARAELQRQLVATFSLENIRAEVAETVDRIAV